MRQTLPLLAAAQAQMDRRPCSYVQSILAGTAEIEDGCVLGAVVEGSGKESFLTVVEALDEVSNVF